MSKKANGVNYSRTVCKKNRRERVIAMLEKQLKNGKKREKVIHGAKTIPLTEKDIKRIEKEIDILKARI
jgi:hypothetical protein